MSLYDFLTRLRRRLSIGIYRYVFKFKRHNKSFHKKKKTKFGCSYESIIISTRFDLLIVSAYLEKMYTHFKDIFNSY